MSTTGIFISKSNSIPSASAILDGEFHSFNQWRYSPEENTPIPQLVLTLEIASAILDPEVKVETDPIKISYFEQFNYQINSWIYERLHTYTEQKETLKPVASAAIATSTLFDLILRISSVAETALYSLGLFFLSPFTRDYKKTLYDAYDWISKVPDKVANTITLPIEVAVKTIFMLVEPKSFIIQKAEYAKVQKKHLEKGTLGSARHKIQITLTLSRNINNLPLN